MTNEELEQGFSNAQEKWLKEKRKDGYVPGYSTLQHRYFFWAGSAFGVQATKAIYAESHNHQQEILSEATEAENTQGVGSRHELQTGP